jgi:hypothetical protein
MTDNTRETAAKIAGLNDLLRKGAIGGTVYCTQGVRAAGAAFVADAIRAVRAFSDFTPENDPYGEHDFGSVLVPVASAVPIRVRAGRLTPAFKSMAEFKAWNKRQKD